MLFLFLGKLIMYTVLYKMPLFVTEYNLLVFNNNFNKTVVLKNCEPELYVYWLIF